MVDIGVVTSFDDMGSSVVVVLSSNLSVSGFKIFSTISGSGNKKIKRFCIVVLVTSGILIVVVGSGVVVVAAVVVVVVAGVVVVIAVVLVVVGCVGVSLFIGIGINFLPCILKSVATLK